MWRVNARSLVLNAASTLVTRHASAILAYHSVRADHRPRTFVPSIGRPYLSEITVHDFRSHLAALRSKGYHFVHLREAARYIGGESAQSPPDSLNLSVTFDDGLENNVTEALPVLEEFGVPATFFICIDFMEQGRSSYGLRCLTPEQVAEISKHPLVTIGAHSVSHARVSRLCAVDVRREVGDSIRRLSELVGYPIEEYAYPYGDHSPACVECLRQFGVTRAVTMRARSLAQWMDPLLLPRISMDSGAPRKLIEAGSLGLYDWYDSLRRIALSPG